LEEKSDTKLLTPDDEIIKERLARKIRLPLNKDQRKKKLDDMGLKNIDEL